MVDIEVENEQEIIQEAESVLLEKLGTAKATRFWIALTEGKGNYLDIKRKLFKGETVDSLFKKIQEQD